jgi:hypothetical protein
MIISITTEIAPGGAQDHHPSWHRPVSFSIALPRSSPRRVKVLILRCDRPRGSTHGVRVGLELIECQHAVVVGVGEVELLQACLEELLQGEVAVALPVGPFEILATQPFDVLGYQVALSVLVEEVELLVSSRMRRMWERSASSSVVGSGTILWLTH